MKCLSCGKESNLGVVLLDIAFVPDDSSHGATLYMGFNRALGTLSAGGLALGLGDMCQLAGEWEEVVIILNIFLIGNNKQRICTIWCQKFLWALLVLWKVPSKILTYEASDDPVYSGYRSVVQSTSQEDALAPAERRQAFLGEIQRVCTAGAKVLHELGTKVKTMEKLGTYDILFKVHEAAEDF